MKWRRAIALALASVVVSSCGGSAPPLGESRLQVYVYWEGAGLAEKRLEVLELGVEKRTDNKGIAEFLVPTGTYTLRAYEITTPGPARAYVDITVTTTQGETTRVDVIDCLPCLTPSQAGEVP